MQCQLFQFIFILIIVCLCLYEMQRKTEREIELKKTTKHPNKTHWVLRGREMVFDQWSNASTTLVNVTIGKINASNIIRDTDVFIGSLKHITHTKKTLFHPAVFFHHHYFKSDIMVIVSDSTSRIFIRLKPQLKKQKSWDIWYCDDEDLCQWCQWSYITLGMGRKKKLTQ